MPSEHGDSWSEHIEVAYKLNNSLFVKITQWQDLVN